MVDFDGYYLESDPCLVCNNPEVPYTVNSLYYIFLICGLHIGKIFFSIAFIFCNVFTFVEYKAVRHQSRFQVYNNDTDCEADGKS